MAMVFINICIIFFFSANFTNGIGVNWGQTTSHNLQPKNAAQLIKDNGITSVKLFGSVSSMISVFAKTGISVIVGISNDDLQKYSVSYSDAKDWVETNVVKHVNDESVNITYVAVGNEPFSKIYNGVYEQYIFSAIKNIQKALDEAGLGNKIKATTPLNEDVVDSASKAPSECDFRKDIKDKVVEMVIWFNTNKSPFLLNIDPFRSYIDNNYPEDFVFASPNASALVTDNAANYNNIFDLSIDSLASSLKSAGVPNLKIVVGEIGWPTDGNIKANKTFAQMFYTGFLKKLYSNVGTPLRPGSMEVYLSSLLDENMRSIAKGNHERHLGIFRFDGQPKFPMDLSGQGKEVLPVSAKDVNYQFPFYCVFNPLTESNLSIVPDVIDYACKAVDCTALTYGSSCSNLDLAGNLTYIFNMYFQMYSFADDSCNFNGLATMTLVPPTPSTCFFPIQLQNVVGRVAFGASEIIVWVFAILLLALFKEGL